MAPRKTTNQHTTIGKDLIRNGSGVITAADVDEAIEAEKAKTKTTTPRKKAPAKKATTTPPKKRTPRKTPKTPAPDEPWDQQPNETTPAFAAFVMYRDMGATRSLSKVARELGKSTQLVARWSSAHSWQIRVSAYDKFLDREWQQEVKERKRIAARRNADMAAQAMDMVAKRIAQMSKHMATQDVEGYVYDPENPGFDVLDIRRLVESLGKLERLALGESTENVAVTGKNGGPVQVDYTKLTDEERIERMKHLRAEMDKRLDAAGANGDDE